jgi:hypothetical protein
MAGGVPDDLPPGRLGFGRGGRADGLVVAVGEQPQALVAEVDPVTFDPEGNRWFEDRTKPEPRPLFRDESSWRPIHFVQEPREVPVIRDFDDVRCMQRWRDIHHALPRTGRKVGHHRAMS